ncbi:GatB/YqeY domain-containing protein [Rhodomicrobium sp. Az07]|uniref:GatB/YqeY domain-containing protein n=1 Tax=Rhodomicrobium sp. Az07 TaxID=2839034 RepID=UPI001BE76723|nr:GatB/YqeY domain-containing protein [Rhodomicrobium sp. Az07]MBT3070238.1 GatB/YqeY domain-containing protein [Rhodomicrobium sp. Az07]
MIRQKISETLKDAMRAKDEMKTTTLRMVNAAIKQKDIDVARGRGDEHIGEDEVLNLLQSLIKSRRESVELYRKGDRPDLVAKEEAEIAIISDFLPKQMSEDELKAAVKDLVASLGATGVKDMGKVMAALKANFAGQLDMTKASAVVKEVLAGN